MTTSREATTRWRGRTKKLLAVTATAIVASVALSVPAFAVISKPPTNGIPVVFPERDFVSAEGYTPNTPMTIQVIRNGVTIATAQGTTDSTGFLEVNHPGGVCWQGSTPNILPGDEVRFLTGPDQGDAVETANVSAEQAFINAAGNVQVNGNATGADGTRIPITRLEQRIINPDFRVENPGPNDSQIGRRDIRADSAGGVVDRPGGRGLLTYDTANPQNGDWTAIYTGLNQAEKDLAVAGQTRVLSWMNVLAGERNGITIYEVGEIGGPGFGGCPQAAEYAVTDSNHDPGINVANAGRALVLSGVSQDASGVSVVLDDQNPNTRPLDAVTGTPTGTGAQTWRVSIPSGRNDPAVRGFADLSDGTLTATATYAVAGGNIGGLNLRILKDTRVPAAPTATPGPGTYKRSQRVTLDHSDVPATKVRYTVNPTAPVTANSRVFVNPIPVTATQTIRAAAFDPAGNRSAVKAFRYVIR